MSNKPTCDRCSAPAVHHEIDGSMLCHLHHAEEMRIREYAKVRLYDEGPDKTIFGCPVEIVELPDAPTEATVMVVRGTPDDVPSEFWPYGATLSEKDCVRLYGEGSHEESAMGPWKLEKPE